MTFYEKASLLDQLIELDSVSIENEAVLMGLIKEQALYRYFFETLCKPAWFPHLQETGLFSDPPSPITKEGKTWVPKWEVMDYLMKGSINPRDFL